jgi:hypothetical protein
MNRSSGSAIVGVALLAAGSTSLVASTATFTTPDFRGHGLAQFAGWESFTVPTGAPGNAPDIAGSNASAKLTQSTPGAFIASSGNLYVGPDPAVGSYEVSYAGIPQLGLGPVVLQVRALGNELSYDSVRLNYSGGSLAAVREELERTPFGGPPGTPGSGFAVASKWSWDVSHLGISDFTITFAAAAADVSFDSAMLDVQAVPEPETWALMGLGAGALALAGWRRR